MRIYKKGAPSQPLVLSIEHFYLDKKVKLLKSVLEKNYLIVVVEYIYQLNSLNNGKKNNIHYLLQILSTNNTINENNF